MCVPALSYDLTFPEVFFPSGVPHGKHGFNAVLGNPPWDAILFKSKEFFAAFDIDILDAPTKREREQIESRLLADSHCGQLFEQYKSAFEKQKRANDVLYEYQKIYIEGDLAGRQADAFRVFMERNTQLLSKSGWTGVVVPSAFHANEGATGIRRLYLEKLNLRKCYSFENHRKLFEIDSRVKFATLVVQANGPTKEFECAFYIHDDEWLFDARMNAKALTYTSDFVKRTGGDYLTLLEIRSQQDLEIAEISFFHGEPFGDTCSRLGIRFGAECHMTNDAFRFTPLIEALAVASDPRDPENTMHLNARGFLILHEGKTFRQYDDRWGSPPRYVVSVSHLRDRPILLNQARYFRLAHRIIAGPGDENISIWAIHPPGTTHGNSSPVENKVNRKTCDALVLLAITNSTMFDYLLGLRVRANVLAFIRDSQPTPKEMPLCFLSHCATRLSCNHAGYAPLWQEQLGAEWREGEKQPLSWPVLAGEVERWAVRAAIDAVVADSYGLSREQYAHVLSTFSHATYKKAPEICLGRFDELRKLGLEAFTKKHDPYWDIPLNESLPEPVIDLPILDDGLQDDGQMQGEEKDTYRLSRKSQKAPKKRKT